METIKRKSGLRYRTMIWINGKCFKSPAFKRKTDCQKWLADQRSRKVESVLYGDAVRLKEKISFKEFAKIWFEGKKSQNLSSSTIRNYERHLNVHLLPHLGGIELKKIQRFDLERLQSYLSKEHNPKGLSLIMTVLKAIFVRAQEDGYILRNPMSGFKGIPNSSSLAVEAFWTKAEIDQFLKANVNNSLYNLFLIAMNTGLRKGELAGLKWDRVDFSLNQITITRTRNREGLKETTKTKLKRFIPMNSMVRATLLNLFYSRKGSEYVFVDMMDSPIEIHHIYRDFAKAQTKAKISNKIRFHDLRHTFASQFMMNGGNVFDLQKILGHTDIKMTMRYAHYSPEHLQKAILGFELGEVLEPNQILTTAFGKRSENVREMAVVNG